GRRVRYVDDPLTVEEYLDAVALGEDADEVGRAVAEQGGDAGEGGGVVEVAVGLGDQADHVQVGVDVEAVGVGTVGGGAPEEGEGAAGVRGGAAEPDQGGEVQVRRRASRDRVGVFVEGSGAARAVRRPAAGGGDRQLAEVRAEFTAGRGGHQWLHPIHQAEGAVQPVHLERLDVCGAALGVEGHAVGVRTGEDQAGHGGLSVCAECLDRGRVDV